jgi:hypothetical protein
MYYNLPALFSSVTLFPREELLERKKKGRQRGRKVVSVKANEELRAHFSFSRGNISLSPYNTCL